jgi:predicted DNA-binding transcriptional regulator YafY
MARYHDKFLRLVAIDYIIRTYRTPVSKQLLIERCEEATSMPVSPSSLEKDLHYMRNIFDAPIEFCNVLKGYYYTDNEYEWLHQFCQPMAEKLSEILNND